MAEHESDVFFIGTANDISKLPPEFTRAERLDAVFFLDDMSPIQGPKLGPFPRRSVAIVAEQLWLEAMLTGASQHPRS